MKIKLLKFVLARKFYLLVCQLQLVNDFLNINHVYYFRLLEKMTNLHLELLQAL